MIEISAVDQLELGGKRVFYRVDYNVPLENGEVSDTTRIEETFPTIHMMRERGASIVIGTHLGRPKGKRDDQYSLRVVRGQLTEMLGLEVAWADDCVGEEAETKAAALRPGQILMLENLRFHAEEESNDEDFARKLHKLGEIYVNDAFGACHRAHASIVALPKLFPEDKRAGGWLLANELRFLQKITAVSERPFVTVMGGAKIAGKIEPLEVLVNLADRVLIGGGMANTFLASQGVKLGSSLVDEDSKQVASRTLSGAGKAKIVLPVDLVVTDSLDSPKIIKTIDVKQGVEDGMRAVDIGPRTIRLFSDAIAPAKTVFWNGPMGVFENPAFAAGTKAIAVAVATSNAISVVGGGESVEAAKHSGYADRISHLSTGGGASLEFIAGSKLPGVEVLRKSVEQV